MLIGIDGNEANQTKRVGVGEYGFQLLKHLYRKQKTENRKQTTFTVYLKEQPLKDLPVETKWWQYKVVGPKFFWTQIGLPLALFQVKPVPDVFFTPTHYAPRFSSCPIVISIMDLSFICFPRMFKKRDLFKLKNWTAYSVKKAKKILTISKSTRDDIIKYYKIEPKKVVVAYPGVNNLRTQMANLKAKSKIFNPRKKYGIKGDYILYVGTLQPRKNLLRLIEAFKKIKKQKTKNKKQKEELKELKLVIVGKKGWMYEEIFAKVGELEMEDEVIFTGYVPDEDLAALYQGAKCFVLVSLYEGFGFPVLEAMRLGVPVVCSNLSSLPEITGKAAVLVDPYNVREIAQGIVRVLSYDKTKRQRIIEEGLKQTKKFSWEKCARETLKVLIEAARE